MTRSGAEQFDAMIVQLGVLIPLLVDDPLWVMNRPYNSFRISLNPSFSG